LIKYSINDFPHDDDFYIFLSENLLGFVALVKKENNSFGELLKRTSLKISENDDRHFKN
jgi:hypothetical protein